MLHEMIAGGLVLGVLASMAWMVVAFRRRAHRASPEKGLHEGRHHEGHDEDDEGHHEGHDDGQQHLHVAVGMGAALHVDGVPAPVPAHARYKSCGI